MADIKDQKLIYHLTALENMSSISSEGLKARAQILGFRDVADHQIIDNRKILGLETFGPFHWFAKNPFAGSVQITHRNNPFVLITVHRELAEREGWKVIPRHPLANDQIELLDYSSGFKAIDWQLMNKRDYSDPLSKSVCMAECLSPITVPVAFSYTVFVPNTDIAKVVIDEANKIAQAVDVVVNENMFLK
jgi:hypothetical protein